jgi:hypothetical protein
MQPPAYLYLVRISAGWAVVCEHCQTTITTCQDRDQADAAMLAHELAHQRLSAASALAPAAPAAATRA